jgi:thiol-disulfide isomerase/thioredoxin
MNFVLAYECSIGRRVDVKKRSLLFVFPAVIPFILTSIMAKAQSSATPQIPSACDSFGVVKSLVERKAPPFSLKMLDTEKVVSLSDFKETRLVKVLATWCPSCVEELPPMEKFSQGRNDQLVILMAAIDGKRRKSPARH